MGAVVNALKRLVEGDSRPWIGLQHLRLRDDRFQRRLHEIVTGCLAARQRTRIATKIGEAFGHLLRSEEHTSELQSLMRNSYAVFCLKKKTINQIKTCTYSQ